MAITTKSFGKTPDGTEVSLYTIQNDNGFTAEVTDLGAILVRLFVPDKAGQTADVVLDMTVRRNISKKAASMGRRSVRAQTALTMQALSLTA